MKYLMDLIYVAAAAGYSPVVVYRRLRYGRYRTGWANRFGKISRKEPQKKCIWIHAVSVGEVNATRTIVKELQNKFGDFEILLTTTTDTGFARANALYGDRMSVCYFPLDFSWIMARAFKAIRPSLCLLMELELWPNLVEIANELDVPIVIVNGRISKRSYRRYKMIKPLAAKVFRKVSLVLAQTPNYAARFQQVGCPAEKIVVTGSLKYDTAQITNKVAGSDTLAEELDIAGQTLWVAGGTGNDEEKLIIDVFKKLHNQERFSGLRLAIVPRKPERFDEVAGLIKQNGFELLRYSGVKGKTRAAKTKPDTIILGDTMGDLRNFYSLATVIFVGRSLVPMGGSDMAEAAALGKCTVFGPHAFNFQQTVDVLLEGDGAVLVRNAQELEAALEKCLGDPAYARRVARNGQQVIRNNQGATAKSIERISQLLT